MQILFHKEDMEKDRKDSPTELGFAVIIIAISGVEGHLKIASGGPISHWRKFRWPSM
jgi:hypothetical protein